jgi:hypothetical protein
VRFASIASWRTFEDWLGECSVDWAPSLSSVVLDGAKMPTGEVFGELRPGLPVPDIGEFEAQQASGVGWLSEALSIRAAVDQVLSDGVTQVDLPRLIGDRKVGAACGSAVSRRLLKDCEPLSEIKLGSMTAAIEARPECWLPEYVPMRESLDIHINLDLRPSNVFRASIWLGRAVDLILGWRAGPVSLCLVGRDQLRLRIAHADIGPNVSCHGSISQLDGVEEQVIVGQLFDRLGSGISQLDLSGSPIGAQTLQRVHALVLRGSSDQFDSLKLGPHGEEQYSRYREELDGFKAALCRSLEIPILAQLVED